MANVGAERLLKIPSSKPERHFPSDAAQTRIVSAARIRLDSGKSVRSFKAIICGDISEFESYMLSHAVWSLWAMSGLRNYAQQRSGSELPARTLGRENAFNYRRR
jgi:hypothetical protein